MREWRDIHSQLASLVAELDMKANTTPATFEQIHRALLAGLQDEATALHIAAYHDKTGAVLKPLLGALEGAGILKEGLQAKTTKVRETATPSTFFIFLSVFFVYFYCNL